MARSKALVLHQQQQQQQQQHQHREQHVRSIRIRRAILAGKRGPSTPVPSWKLYENPSYNEAAAAAAATANTSIVATNGRQIAISARRLAATLWELQELPICRVAQRGCSSSSGSKKPKKKQHQRRESVGSPKLMLPPPSPTTPVPQHSTTKPASSGKSSDSNRRSPYSDTAAVHNRRTSDTSEGSRQSYEESTSHEFTCSKDVLKVLRNGETNKAQPSPALVLLQAELEQTRLRVKQLEHANKVARKEMEELLEWREQEEDRMKAALSAMQREVEDEKRKKHRLEAANKKVVAQAEEARAALAAAAGDLERERKARRLMEDVCDELAREIGRDKAEVEELKMAAYKAREEVEEERRMLQMAEVWREERVQMKLGEARHELEEKNVELDRLKAELEEFLASKSSTSNRKPSSVGQPQSTSLTPRGAGQRKGGGGGGGSSGEDDLHSIDLNKESLYDRTQGNRWTYGKRHQAQPQPQPQQQDEDDGTVVLPSTRGFKERRRPRTRLRKSRNFELQQKQKREEIECSSSSSSSSASSDNNNNGTRSLKSSSPVFSGRIETIPEHSELYNARKPHVLEAEGFAFRRPAEGSRTPMLSRPASAAFGPSSSSSGAWPEEPRDNSLRAKLLEEDALPLRTKRRGK